MFDHTHIFNCVSSALISDGFETNLIWQMLAICRSTQLDFIHKTI